jgi:hypothetical protein
MRNDYYIPYSYVGLERTTLLRHQIRNGFVFSTQYNSRRSNGRMKSDASSVFIPKAREFSDYFEFSSPVLVFDNDSDNDGVSDGDNLRLRRREIIDAIDNISGTLNVIAYFGHGSSTGLLSAGFRSSAHRELFAEAIARKSNDRVVVILYACRSGSVGGFARELWTDLLNHGVRSTIFGHETSGHATKNPYKRRYPGGAWVVEPGSRLWPTWIDALNNSNLWIRYPFLEPHALRTELESRLTAETTVRRISRTGRRRQVGPIGCNVD